MNHDWWKKSFLHQEEEFETIKCSGKMLLLFSILSECEVQHEKVLVFSQSLHSLDMIEKFLTMIDSNTRHSDSTRGSSEFYGKWEAGKDYFRLDGQTTMETRFEYCKTFSDVKKTQSR